MTGGGDTPSPTPYVDLELPSGLLWRRYNIGASVPEEMGLYFSWGNVEGHPEDSGYNFSQAEYNASPGGAINTDLSLEQDAARVILGAPWRMPTSAEFKELSDNCTTVWTTRKGVYGRLFTSKVNGETIFFPAAGYYNGTSLTDRGSYGIFWSSSYISETNARDLYINSSGVGSQDGSPRHYGITVRAVRDQ